MYKRVPDDEFTLTLGMAGCAPAHHAAGCIGATPMLSFGRQQEDRVRQTIRSATIRDGVICCWAARPLAALAALGLPALHARAGRDDDPRSSPAPAGGRSGPTSSSSSADDIGLWNLSVWNKGMMGFKTPNIDRIANEGALTSTYYGQQSCTAGARRLHHRPVRRSAPASPRSACRIAGRPAEGRPDDCRCLKPLGYMRRPVRQEPSGRPRRVPADRARLRRVLRQPLSPQRRGGAREIPTIRRIRSSARSSARAACSKALGRRQDRGHRPAHDEAHGDGRRGVPGGARQGFHGAPGQGRQAVLRLVQLHAHARVHAPEAGVRRQDRAGPPGRRHGRA